MTKVFVEQPVYTRSVKYLAHFRMDILQLLCSIIMYLYQYFTIGSSSKSRCHIITSGFATRLIVVKDKIYVSNSSPVFKRNKKKTFFYNFIIIFFYINCPQISDLNVFFTAPMRIWQQLKKDKTEDVLLCISVCENSINL